MEALWICPICHAIKDEVSHVVPCGHQFCLGCIGRWAEISSGCPICRGPIDIIKFSVRSEDDYLLLILENIDYFSSEELETLDDSSETDDDSPETDDDSPETDDDSPEPDDDLVAPPPSPQELPSSDDEEAVGGLLPRVWAQLFQREEHLLDPVLPWLRQELTRIYGAQWWKVNTAVCSILHTLCLYGPDEETMVQILQSDLGEDTAAVVHGVVSIIESECSEEAHRLLVSCAAEQEDNSPAPSPSSTNSSSSGGTPPNDLAFSGSPDVSQ